MTDGVAFDGSPVEIYRHLPAGPEIDLIDGAIGPASAILDLGSGTGRMTRALIARGHRVTAVDNSAAMLAALAGLPDVETVEADMLELELGRRFAVVLLASHFVNTPAPEGPRFLETAARHVSADGAVLIEAYSNDLDWAASVGRRSTIGPVGITVMEATVSGDHLDAVVAYDLGDRRWEQPFNATLLDEDGLRDLLARAGLRFDRWLDAARTWLVATPA